ncbi:hypothetical protein [Synechococcus phage S-B68]|nr:hypothetical protein [Synechococcus phage S-B68]
MVFHGFDVYRTYLAMKQHFTSPKFDFFQYDGKINAKESTYQARSDFYFFETLARKLTPQEIREYLLSSFIYSKNPAKVWIGDIKRNGKDNWVRWQKQNQSLKYIFKQDLGRILEYMENRSVSFNDMFSTKYGHPNVLKLYIREEISIETLILLDMVLKFVLSWDRDLADPLWETLSLKIKKYKPFMSIPVSEYKEIMKETFM